MKATTLKRPTLFPLYRALLGLCGRSSAPTKSDARGTDAVTSQSACFRGNGMAGATALIHPALWKH